MVTKDAQQIYLKLVGHASHSIRIHYNLIQSLITCYMATGHSSTGPWGNDLSSDWEVSDVIPWSTAIICILPPPAVCNQSHTSV